MGTRTAMLQSRSSLSIATSQETCVDVQEGPMLLCTLLFSCSVGFVVGIWVAKEEGCWS